MIHRLAMSAVLASLLVACATTNPGYYASGHDGYGDYYYDNPQVIVDEHYASYWGGPYWGGFYGYGYPAYGFGYGPGYFPGDCFGFQYGYTPGFCGGYYDPWLYGRYSHRHHHGHDHDRDHGSVVVRNDGKRHEAEQFSDRNGLFGQPAVRAPDPQRHPGVFGDDRMQRPNRPLPNLDEPRRESRQDLPRHHRDADGGNH